MLETFTTPVFLDILEKIHDIIWICFIAIVTFTILNYSLSFQHAVTEIMRYAIKRKKEDADFSIMDIQWYLSNVYPNHQYRPGLKELFSEQNEEVIYKYLGKRHFYPIIGYVCFNRDIIASYKNPLIKIFPKHKNELLKKIQQVISDFGISGEVEATIFYVLKENDLTSCDNIVEFAQLFNAQFQNAGKTPKWVGTKYNNLFFMNSGSQIALYLSNKKINNLYNNIKALITCDIGKEKDNSICTETSKTEQ